MNRSYENRKSSSLWFIMVDILIILLLAGVIASLFLLDKTGGGNDEDLDVERLTFAVTVEDPYDVSLFLQEGKGVPIPLRFSEGENPFGWLSYGQDGQFYIECARSFVRASEDLDGLWYLGETMLLNGTALSVQSALADFSVTVVSLPRLMLPGTAGTTESAPADTNEPSADESGADGGVTEDDMSTDEASVGEPSTDADPQPVGEPFLF